MEPFQKTKRPLILHQKIMGNPNMKNIDDKKVVLGSQKSIPIPEGKKYPRKKNPEDTLGALRQKRECAF